MKALIGLILVLIGIIVGLYVGIYICFIGGIIQLIQSVTPVIIAKGIAWGLAKIFCASLVGWLCAIIPIGIGGALIKDE